MRKLRWILVSLMFLTLLADIPAFAAGKGKDMGQGNGNQTRQIQNQGQWVNNHPPGWSAQGQKKGWAKKGATTPVGLNKNYDNTGKYPKGLQKTR